MASRRIGGRNATAKTAAQMRVGDLVYIGNVNGQWDYRRVVSIRREDKFIVVRFENNQEWWWDTTRKPSPDVTSMYYVAHRQKGDPK